MNQMQPIDMQGLRVDQRDTQTHDQAPSTNSMSEFLIKRSGQRPLQFDGIELCMAMSYIPNSEYWYEINVYRRSEQDFVLAIRIFFESVDERDRVRAWECATFDEVLKRLENYDAAEDIRVEISADTTALSVPDLAAQSYFWRARATAARQQFAGLVGEILHELSSS
ncbi:MAG: hypothetical protein ACFBSD_04110 [Paracoccaceae bacterium]